MKRNVLAAFALLAVTVCLFVPLSTASARNPAGGSLSAKCLECVERVKKAAGCNGKDVSDPAWNPEICAKAVVQALDECKSDCAN
jgi:hypothetical protein